MDFVDADGRVNAVGGDAFGVAAADEADKLEAGFGQVRVQGAVQAAGEGVGVVVRVAQDAEEFEPQDAPECFGDGLRVRGGQAQAGAGVVYDSNPDSEWQETINKASALIAAAALLN